MTLQNKGELIVLKDNDWLARQRIAGHVAAKAIGLLENEVKNCTSKTLLELDKLAHDFILDNNCTPTFLNYNGFPNSCCISINKELVHGIPKDRRLQDGDLVTFDLGTTYEGAIADTATTCIFGIPNSKHILIIKATEECLLKGIQAIEVGKRLGVIGEAISKHAKTYGFGLISNYGGHGLDWNVLHAAPFVSNKSSHHNGITIQPGLVIAIEPMLAVGGSNTRILSDKWTVITNDINTHVEHSVFVHKDHVEIITWRETEQIITQPRYFFKSSISLTHDGVSI